MLGKIAERVQRRLKIAGPGKLAGEIPGVGLQFAALLAQKRCEQTQYGAPTLHRLAVTMNGLGARLGAVLDDIARLSEDVLAEVGEDLADRNLRGHGGLVVHGSYGLDLRNRTICQCAAR